MKLSLSHSRRVFKLAESRGHMFDASVYLSLRAEGWNSEGALSYARRAYAGVARPYRHYRNS